jgi:hypothetical protein
VKINEYEVPSPLKTLRVYLGDERVVELQERASALCAETDYSAEELLCLAEFFRLIAEGAAWIESRNGNA